MAEEPGDSDESPDDASPSSPDSDASPPGDEADDDSADDSAVDGGPADGDDLTSAIRGVSDDGDASEDDEPIPAVREVGDGGSGDEDAGDGDDADSRTEVEYDASEAEELFSIPDPEDADDGDGDEAGDGGETEDGDGGDERPDLEDAYPDRGEIETPPARDEHGSDGDDGPDHATVDDDDHPTVDDAHATIDDDMDAPLAGEVARGEADAPASDGDEASEASRVSSDAPASDGGYADEVGGGNEYGHGHDEIYDDEVYDDEEWEPEGAPDDEEMPLADHIEEMVRRLGVVVVVMAIVSGVVFPFAEELINFLWFSYLPGELAQCPGQATTAAASTENPGPPYCARVYHPLGLILARLKVATLVGFIVALPVFVYETYLFMRPGLYPHERRYYLASVPTSTVLAAVGVAFAHFLVIPAIFTYFLRYSEEAAGIAFGLTETFDLMVLLMGGFAIVFQIPLFIMLALMMDLVTRKWLHDRRLLFWGAFAGIAFLFSPDPTGMAPIIVAVTMIVLFEGTLYLAKWTGRG